MPNYQEIRDAEKARILANEKDYYGRKGRANELDHANTKSRKVKVSKQGETDVFVKIRNAKGKVRYVDAENKTSGGRIDSLYKSGAPKYVIYQMIDAKIPQSKSAKAKGIPQEIRNTPAVVIPTDLFLATLERFGAIKEMSHGGIVDGLGVQVSNKQWYLWLLDYPVLWVKDHTYEIWEFEGLE